MGAAGLARAGSARTGLGVAVSPLRQGPVDEKLARRIILVVSAAGLLDGGIWVSAMDSSSYTYNGQHFDIPRSTPQTGYILGLGGCRARDDHAAPRLAGETCSILANQPQLGLAAADPPESGCVGSMGLGLQLRSSFAPQAHSMAATSGAVPAEPMHKGVDHRRQR